jgi:hypothetical protein
MKVSFELRDLDALPLREAAERRVREVTRRLRWLVPHTRVRLDAVGNGGVDKLCRLEFATRPGKPVVVTALARDWRTALDRALQGAARRVLSVVRRARHAPRHRVVTA